MKFAEKNMIGNLMIKIHMIFYKNKKINIRMILGVEDHNEIR